MREERKSEEINDLEAGRRKMGWEEKWVGDSRTIACRESYMEA